mgnify:CR=1 FL=1
MIYGEINSLKKELYMLKTNVGLITIDAVIYHFGKGINHENFYSIFIFGIVIS